MSKREISEVRVLQIARELMATSRRNHPVACAFEVKDRPAEVPKLFRIQFEDNYPDITIALPPDSTEDTVRNSIQMQIVARESL